MHSRGEEEKLKHLLDKIHLSVGKLYHIATHDAKTGVHNYVFFKDMFDMELEQARRGKTFSLAVFDIDFFKKINDTYGHIEADRILVKLAKLLEEKIRKYDIVARFGGEEFVILFPDTSLRKAHLVTERLRKEILKDTFLARYKVTVSGGVSSYKPKDNFDKVSKRADKALYRAKKDGRNRVYPAE